MIAFILILICFLLAGSALGIFAFVAARRLERRVQALEGRLGILADADKAVMPPEPPPAEPQQASTPNEASPESQQDASAAGTEAPAHEVNTTEQGTSDQPDPHGGPRQSLDERFGARWAVWIGGLALVLGGAFLVRYSIEAGLLTPHARVAAGAVLALGLIATGEWLRRRTLNPNAGDSEKMAYVPGVLTLAGTTTAFASVFAAHALYGLIGPGSAFLALAVVALLTLVAALVHGPGVASYGLLASYVVPFLVQAEQPAAWPLALYGVGVTSAAYAVARIRLWRWLAFAGAGGAIFWAHVLTAAVAGPSDPLALATYEIATLAMAAYVFVISLYPRTAAGTADGPDWPAALVLFAHAFPILYLLQVDAFGATSLVTLLLVAAGLLVIAMEWPAAAGAAAGSAVLTLLAYLSWNVPLAPVDVETQLSGGTRIAAALADPVFDEFLRTGVLLGAMAGCLSVLGVWRSTARWTLAGAGVATPLGLLGIAYLRLAPLETSLAFGMVAIGLAVAWLGVLAFVDRHLPDQVPGRNAALAAYAVGTVGALAIAMAMLLTEGWLPVGLALLTAGTIWVHRFWRLPALPWIGIGSAVLTCGAIGWNPTIVGDTRLGATPVFNALLYGYGVPALSFAYSAWQLGQVARDRAQQVFEALALFMTLVMAAVLIHHALNGGDFYARPDTLAEWSLHGLILLAGSLAVQRLDRIAPSPVLYWGTLALGLCGFATIAQANLVEFNPLLTDESVGQGAVFNLLLPAYLLPAILCAIIALRATRRPNWYRVIAGSVACALMFAWISLEVRAVFHRPHLQTGASSDIELYSYSAAWLVFGVLLLLAGVRLEARKVRLASMAFILAAVAKVFLFDMSDLQGVWRAVSFIGLGGALIGIGLVYQHLMRARDHDGSRPDQA